MDVSEKVAIQTDRRPQKKVFVYFHCYRHIEFVNNLPVWKHHFLSDMNRSLKGLPQVDTCWLSNYLSVDCSLLTLHLQEAIAIVLDVGPSMNQAPGGEATALNTSLDAINMILQRKVRIRYGKEEWVENTSNGIDSYPGYGWKCLTV